MAVLSEMHAVRDGEMVAFVDKLERPYGTEWECERAQAAEAYAAVRAHFEPTPKGIIITGRAASNSYAMFVYFRVIG